MKYDKPFPIPNYDMKQTADEILQKHEDANEMHFHQVDRQWIIQAMEEYASQKVQECVEYYNAETYKTNKQ